MLCRPSKSALVALAFLGVSAFHAFSGDWPMWRYDARRSAASPHEIAGELHLHWTRDLGAPRRAWPWQMDDYEKLAFDKSYEMVAADGLLYVPSMVSDTVTAYDADTGEELWRYYADGPVRFAPLVWEGRVYAVSDDGCLHCLDARTGELVWKFNAAPSSRKVLGNERLISLWPARGAPVIADGTLYFAAGIWPHEGVFICALDARTAEVQWVNSGSPSDLVVDSKRYYSFGGVAPQGQLAVEGGHLFVPGGRTPPAAFDRATGEQLYYSIATHSTGKGAGGHSVFTRGEWFFNVRDNRATHMYAISDAAQYGSVNVDLTTPESLIGADAGSGRVAAYASALERTEEDLPQPEFDRLGRPIPEERPTASRRAPSVSGRLVRNALRDYYRFQEQWRLDGLDGIRRLHAKAEGTLYGSGNNGRIFAIRASEGNGGPELLWTKDVEGEVFSIIPANGRLFVSTEEGRIYCFGPGEREAASHELAPENLPMTEDGWAETAAEILIEVDPRGGYSVMFGVGTGQLLDELLRQSDLHITAYDPDAGKVADLRRRYAEAGLYGRRVAVHEGDATTHRLPPYVASLVASEDPQAAGLGEGANFAAALFSPLRPYGGVAAVMLEEGEQGAFAAAVAEADLENARLERSERYALLSRPGPLPGAAWWTHQYADAANTAYSPDSRAKAPLGIAWFGGEPNHKVLPRHMNGPIPQVVAGRLIILGPHHISARCVYTGVELWAKEMPFVGRFFTQLDEEGRETGFPNQPGANFVGSPFASSEDSVYIIYEDRCYRLDAATGEELGVFELPERDALRQRARDPLTQEMVESYGARIQEGEPLKWVHVRYLGDVLIAAAYPHMFDDAEPGRANNWNATSSEFVVAMDRRSGEILWAHQARYGFRHNAIVAGAGKVFVIDNLSSEIMERLQRRGIEPDTSPQIRALDIRTGEVLWTYDEDVFGTALAYSEPQDALVQSGHLGRRRALPDEPRDRIVVLRGETGEALWADSSRQRRSPLGLHAAWGQILGSTGEGAWDMLTGERMRRVHPFSGEEEDWSWLGALRCGTQNYSKHLALFRSGAAGFTDLPGAAQSGNMTGFRPGCTNNLVAADGIVNAPEYSRSCSCSYQLQTSLGLVHMPDAEMWTFSSLSQRWDGSLLAGGVNFGAPASRFDSDRGVLWVEHPGMVGPAPEMPVEFEANGEVRWLRQHSSFIAEENGSYRWVAASGVAGEATLRVSQLEPGTPYAVRLHFAELERGVEPGQRVFDIVVDGETVLSRFDVAAETGGAFRGAVKEITRTPGEGMAIELRRSEGSELPPVICGIEIVAEKAEQMAAAP